MSATVRIGRFLLKALGALLLLLFLVVGLLNLPFVQDRLTGYAESYLSKKTGVAVTVDKIAINFLGHLLIREVLVPDQQQDTLLHLGKLEVGVQLRGLLNKQVRIKTVALDDVLVDLHPVRGTVMNYQFLIDAFSGGPEEETAPPAAEQKDGPAWDIILPGAHLALNRVEFDYCLPDSATVMNYRVGRFEGHTDRVDLLAGRIGLDRLALADTDIYIKVAGDDSEPPDTSASTLDYRIDAGELSIANTRYRMDLEDLQIDSYVGSAVADDNHVLLLGDTMRIEIARFDLSGSRYRMDTPSAPPAPGFDYSHMDLDGIEIRIADFHYDNLDITGQVEQIAGRDQCGFVLSGFQTRVHYNLDSIELWQLHAFTPQTRINAEHGKVTFPFLEDSTLFELMLIDLQLDSTVLSPADVAYFVPQLDEQDWFRQHREQPLRLEARVFGTLADLAVTRFDLQGWEARANLSGRLQHVTDMDRLAMDLRIAAIESTGPGIRKWLPAGTLPNYLELPDDVLLRGTVKGPLQRLALQLEATTARPSQPLAARLQLGGVLGNVLDPDRLYYDMGLDTIWLSRMEMNAYLPDSFPAYIELPEAVALTGKLKGTMDTVFADLDLKAYRDTLVSEIQIAGTVDSFTNTEALTYDLKLNELIVQPEEMAAYLPDSTLPDYLRLPLIEHGEGAFRGDLADIDAQFEIDLSDGVIVADAKLKDSAYVANLALQDFSIQGLFADSTAYDTVVGWPAPPIDLQVIADGRGLDIERDLRADASVRLRFLGDTIRWDEGLVLKGRVERQSFRGLLTVHENEVDVDLEAMADFNPGQDTATLEGKINKLDLYALKVLEVPFNAQTGLVLGSRGRSLDSLHVTLLASDFDIMYNGISESTDNLAAVLERDKARDYLSGIITSDFLEAYLVDEANNPALVRKGLQELAGRLGISVEKLQLNPDSTKNLYATLEVIRPEIFTSGIVPGLTELSPIEVMGAFDLQDSSLAAHAIFPHIKYRDFAFDSTEVAAVNWDEFFLALLQIPHATLFDDIEVKDLRLTGTQLPDDRIRFMVMQLDTILAPDPQVMPVRFLVAALITREDGVYTARFGEKPIINFDTLWRFDPANELVYGNGELHVRDLRLSRENRSLTIDEVSENQLALTFDNFDLQFFSDIVKWKSDYAAGVADGTVEVADLLGSPLISTDLQVADLGVMGAHVGNLDLQAANDPAGAWTAEAALTGEGNDVALTGTLTPRADSMLVDGKLLAQPLNLASLDSLAKDFATDLGGGLNADLSFSGALKMPVITGALDFDDVTVRPVITGSPLEIPEGRIDFSPGAIMTQGSITLLDSLDNEAKLSILAITEDYSAYLLGGGLTAENFLLLNTTEQDNSLYYGKVFAGIDLSVKGITSEIVDIACTVKPQANSSFFYLYDQGDALDEIDTGEGFVEFVDFDLVDRERDTLAQGERRDTILATSGFDINITADLNRNLGLTVVMDQEAGDRLEGLVQGNVAFRYPPSGEPELTGQMDVSGSKYFYTYQQVIKKEFVLQDGSAITFTGPVDDADINLKAGYTAQTAPYTLVSVYGGIDENSSLEVRNRLQRRQEFLVTIQAQGTLEEAELKADIEYPRRIGNTSTDVVEPALTQLRANSTEMNTQAFSLILFNSFRLSDGATAAKAVFNLKQELGDLLASQLNNLTNKYINFVDVNFGIETLSSDANTLDFENVDFRVGLRKRFLEDRLSVEVDGLASTTRIKKDEYGSEYTEQNMQAFLENVAVEYSLTREGALKIRVFNQYDYDDFIGSNVIKLGGTLVLSKDFNRIIFKKNHQPANHAPPPPVPVSDAPGSTGTEAVEPRDSTLRER